MFTLQTALALFLLVIVGIVTGYMLGKTVTLYKCNKPTTKHAGTMVINTKDPEKDVCRFELDIPIVEMFESTVVSFRVEKEG